MSCEDRAPIAARRSWFRRNAQWTLALVVALGSAVLTIRALIGTAAAEACLVGTTRVEYYEDSRLLAVTASERQLDRGDLLDCSEVDAATRDGLQRALQRFPRELSLLRVHLDPALPPNDLALRVAEVHLGTRELLVDRSRLKKLGLGIWLHEFVHVVADEPPSHLVARRVWLTVEEALADRVAETLVDQRLPARAAGRDARAAASDLPWELLAESNYDPHWLAPELAELLSLGEFELSVEQALDCLDERRPRPASAATTTKESILVFVEGCPVAARPRLRLALQRWLPPELSPFEPSD